MTYGSFFLVLYPEKSRYETTRRPVLQKQRSPNLHTPTAKPIPLCPCAYPKTLARIRVDLFMPDCAILFLPTTLIRAPTISASTDYQLQIDPTIATLRQEIKIFQALDR